MLACMNVCTCVYRHTFMCPPSVCVCLCVITMGIVELYACRINIIPSAVVCNFHFHHAELLLICQHISLALSVSVIGVTKAKGSERKAAPLKNVGPFGVVSAYKRIPGQYKLKHRQDSHS